MKQSTIPALAERQDATIEARVITVSPELAAEWLTRNERNRTLNLNAVTQFAADMDGGRWHFTGQPIIFNKDGVLIDGQHRLSAQVKAGATVDWLVVGGADRRALNYVDIGRPRSVADQLNIGGHTFSNAVAAAARLELVYSGVTNPTKPQVRAFAEAHFGELAHAGGIGRGIAQIIRGSSAAYAVAYFRLAKIDADLADRFFDKLRSGADLAETSPILIARSVIAKTGTARGYTDRQRVLFIDYLFRAWNLWIGGRRVKAFKAPTTTVEPVEPPKPVTALKAV